MTAKHTPGPWATDCDVPTFDGSDLPYVVYINHGTGKGGEICTMNHEPDEGRGRDWEEGKANARLIASAPELLESLKDLEIILSGKPYDRDEQKLLEMARAAIAKAKGKS